MIEFLKKGFKNFHVLFGKYPVTIVIGFIILFKISGWLGFPIPMVWSSGKWIYF